MKSIFVNILFSGLLLFSCGVRAQSFAPGSGVAVKANSAPAVVEQNKPQTVTDAKTEEKAEKKDSVLVNSVEKNFGAKEKEEEKYDNTYSKVVHMRIVDDKVVFDDERFILIYYEDFKIERGLDGLTRCSMRIYVFNDLKDRISSLGFKLKWPEISTSLQMNQVNQGVRTYSDITLLGDGCLSMDKAPTIEVNRCRVKGMSEDKCADAIRWFRKNQ